MLSSSLDTLLKTTSPQKLFAYDCVTLYIYFVKKDVTILFFILTDIQPDIRYLTSYWPFIRPNPYPVQPNRWWLRRKKNAIKKRKINYGGDFWHQYIVYTPLRLRQFVGGDHRWETSWWMSQGCRKFSSPRGDKIIFIWLWWRKQCEISALGRKSGKKEMDARPIHV